MVEAADLIKLVYARHHSQGKEFSPTVVPLGCVLSGWYNVPFMVVPGKLTEQESIVVRGVRVHNLKNVDFEIPNNALTIVTASVGVACIGTAVVLILTEKKPKKTAAAAGLRLTPSAPNALAGVSVDYRF